MRTVGDGPETETSRASSPSLMRLNRTSSRGAAATMGARCWKSLLPCENHTDADTHQQDSPLRTAALDCSRKVRGWITKSLRWAEKPTCPRFKGKSKCRQPPTHVSLANEYRQSSPVHCAWGFFVVWNYAIMNEVATQSHSNLTPRCVYETINRKSQQMIATVNSRRV